ALAVGVVSGLLALTHEQTLVLGPVLLVWLMAPIDRVACPSSPTASAGMINAAQRKRIPLTTLRWLIPPGLFVTGIALVLGLVGWRNYRVGGEVSLTTFQAGPNFYIGNHPGATGRYVALRRGHEAPPFERQDATTLAEAALGSSLTPREVSDYWLGAAWDYIKRHPVAWAKLLLYKWMLVWNAYEIPDTEGYTPYVHLSWLLSVCGGINHFGVLCPLAAVGILATARRWRDLWLLYALLAALAGGVAVFYVLGRYRVPLVPVLAVFAGAGLCEIRRVLRALGTRQPAAAGERPRRPWAVALVAAAVAVATNLPLNPERQLDGMAYANLGAVLGQQQRYEAAAYFLEQAVERVPASVETHYNLGMAYLFQGQPERALAHFQRAQELDPELLEVDYQMGVLYENLGQREVAVRHYQRALEIDPHDEQARQALQRLR
ncbi:MAG: tetratricopeptide repeat protein, partial [Planctomycetota bacterium]